MCGRFALGYPRSLLEEEFHCSLPEEYRPQFNFAPGQDIAVIGRDGGHLMRWGFVPPWAGSPQDGVRAINARSETVFDKPLFRDAVHSARCLVPTQGYYEWRQEGGLRQPYCVRVEKEGGFTTLAGISSRWQDPASGEVLETVAVLTCEPDKVMARLHHRMPVILPHSSWDAWLAPSTLRTELAALLTPFPADKLRVWPVSMRLNDTTNRDSTLMRRSDDPRLGSLPLMEFRAGL